MEFSRKMFSPWSVFFLAVFVGFTLVWGFYHPPTTWDDYIQTVIALGVVFAALTYIRQVNDAKYKEKRDTDLSALSQVGFYREKVNPAAETLFQQVIAFDATYQFPIPPIPVAIFTSDFWRVNFPQISETQANLIIREEGMRPVADRTIERAQREFLNVLEDFSSRVIHTGTGDHPALDSVRSSFVISIEQNMTGIFRYELMQGVLYPAIRNLYDKWKEVLDRRDSAQRLREMLEKMSRLTNRILPAGPVQ